MFSKPHTKRSSLKQPSSTTDLTKDRLPVTTTTSNILSSSANSTSIQPTTQSIFQNQSKKKFSFFVLII